MIVTKIQGGLGNQMFQLAFGYALSKRYKRDLFIEKSFYNNQGNVVRKFELDLFKNTLKEFDFTTNNDGKPWRVINDPYCHFDAQLSENENYFLDGYWQSQKFFGPYKDEISRIFKFDSLNIIRFCEQTDMYNSKNVAVHIRRGDYVDAIDYYPVQNMNYYENALDLIGDYDKIIIFSDDLKWCRNNLKFEKMIFCEGFSSVEDMMIMSKCTDNIIANSTFSWWGANLNENINKKVIAPSKWYGSKLNLETKDLIPESWIKI